MKKLFSELGFHKMDEMEKTIALRAQRIALTYSLIVLILWSLYESYKVYIYQTNLNVFPCFLLVSTCWVLIISQAVLKKQAIKDDEEYQKENPTWKFVLAVILTISIIIAIGSFVVRISL